jgi:hypothetical protein
MSDQVSGHWWVENLLRPVLVAGMMACLASPIALTLQFWFPRWNPIYFLIFAFFGGLEGTLSERALRKRNIKGWAYLSSRGAEAIFLLLVLKLINSLSAGPGQFRAQVQIWLSDPDQVFGTLDLLTSFLFLALWVASLHVARVIRELDAEDPRMSAPPDRTSIEYYLWLTQPPLARERQEALNWLTEVFVWGGVLMLLAAAALHFFLPSVSGTPIAILLYSALGLALLSQARFSVLQATWQRQGIPVQPHIVRRWLVWAVIFLVGVVFLALLLPTQYTMGPIRVLLAGITFIVRAITFVIAFFYFLLFFVLSFIFPSVKVPGRPALNPQPVVPTQPQSGSPGALAWLEPVLSALFWIVIAIAVLYGVFRFLQERFRLLAEETGAAGSWWARFWAWLRDLWARWWTWRRSVQEKLIQRLAQRAAGGIETEPMARFLSLRHLPPRELIRYFYLSTERHAARIGHGRRPSQTPYEYQAELDRAFPDLAPDVDSMTEAFVKAQYDRQQVARTQADAVKLLWQRIKTALRQRRARR